MRAVERPLILFRFQHLLGRREVPSFCCSFTSGKSSFSSSIASTSAGDDRPRHPLVIGRHDVPRSPLGIGGRERFS